MSSPLLFLIGLLGTFSAVVLFGWAYGLAQGERQRAVRLLEAQMDPVASNLREQELARPFAERVLQPLLQVSGSLGRRLTPFDARKRIQKKLVLAGLPERWDVEKVAAFKLLGVIAAGAVGLLMATSDNSTPLRTLGITALLAYIGFVGPDVIIGGKIKERQEAIRRALPDTMDLLTISVEAGLGFDAALAQVMNNVPGPLSMEIARMLQEVQLGVSRIDALRHLGERTDVDELDSFVLSMIQADVFGVSVAKVLRAQAKELRTKRRQRAEEKAMQVPVKILFPLIFCVMPALFVVILGPGAIRIFTEFFGAL
jgi:tight adherence protein C